MRARFALLCLLGSVIAGCGSTSSEPSLTISPSGTAEVSGPTTFSAVVENMDPAVTWAVTAGSLSSTTGLRVVYSPPPGTGAATLTATAGGLSATVQITTAPAALDSKTIPGLVGAVTVQYDAQDIPHIKCTTTPDCIAVQGYLQARDRWFPMDFLRHVARAKLAELIGVIGLPQDVQLRTLFTTRAGHRIEDDLTAALDAPTAALLAAYVGGVNAYLAELRAGKYHLPGEYAQLPFPLTPADVADWTVQDTLALSRLQQFQLSESLNEESANGQFAALYGPTDPGKINAWVRAAAPPSEQSHTLSPTPTASVVATARGKLPTVDLSPWKGVLTQTTARAEALRAQLRPLGAPVGSNNWAVAGSMSTTRMAMVANDPHLSLQYPPLFYLSVMTSTKASDNLDLAGGSFPGIPGALVGRGAHVGWGVTVVGYDVTDVYLEQFAPQAACPGGVAGPPCVVFKGVPTSTLPVPQTYMVRVGAGAAGVVDSKTLTLPTPPPSVVLIIPHHGPVIQAPDALGKAVSVRWTGHEGNTQDVRGILGLNTATDVDAAILALKDFATGAQNFVLADDKGHIAYDPHALVPVRKFTETATPIAPWFPVPGDGSAEWGDGVANCASATATPVPATCWIADDKLPQGKDPAKGYFFTANADPTFPSVTDDNNPLAHPPYLSHSWDDSSGFRATRIEERLAALAATGGMSVADMESIQADHVSRPGKLFAPIIAALPSAGAAPELALAQAVLAQWAANGWDCPTGLLGTDPKTAAVDTDTKALQSSAGCFLFHVFLRALTTNVFVDDLTFAKQGVNGVAAIKAMIYMLTPGTPPEDTTFCNNVDPSTGRLVASHTCAEQIAIAVVQAYRTLATQVGSQPSSWIWGRVHTIQPVSQFGLVINDYRPGPYARPGGAFTVDVGNPSLTAAGLDFAYVSGGNVRHISLMDPTKPVVRMQLPGPERDGPTVLAGPDLLGQWVKNVYFDFAFGDQIDGIAVARQSFQAP